MRVFYEVLRDWAGIKIEAIPAPMQLFIALKFDLLDPFWGLHLW